jgi:hypothetical protein
VLTAVGTYYLVRHLTQDRRGAAIAAICFAFCPFVFAHLPHIQLLMTAGLPFTMLAFHRLIERPSVGRGASLGAVMTAAALGCGYYGVFAILMVGFGVLVVMTMRGCGPAVPLARLDRGRVRRHGAGGACVSAVSRPAAAGGLRAIAR